MVLPIIVGGLPDHGAAAVYRVQDRILDQLMVERVDKQVDPVGQGLPAVPRLEFLDMGDELLREVGDGVEVGGGDESDVHGEIPLFRLRSYGITDCQNCQPFFRKKNRLVRN